MIKDLAHELETLLDQMRQGHLAVSTAIINTLSRDRCPDRSHRPRARQQLDQNGLSTDALIAEVQEHLNAVSGDNGFEHDVELLQQHIAQEQSRIGSCLRTRFAWRLDL